jgi:hypothetical protein
MAAVKATRKVHPKCDVWITGNQLQVEGCLEPALENVPITIEITSEDRIPRYIYLQTDKNGCFTLRSNSEGRDETWLEKGTYTIQVFVTAGGDAAEIECEPVQVHVT